jgi:predicted nucleic acid-binding protein
LKITFDTNVLVYAADIGAGKRHLRAAELLARAGTANCVLTLQSLSEFYNVITRKSGVDPESASAFVRAWGLAFPVVAANYGTLATAMDAVRDHFMPFWDAMMWATARDSGCRLLLSEDFQDGRELGGVLMLNPFLSKNQEIVNAAVEPAR